MTAVSTLTPEVRLTTLVADPPAGLQHVGPGDTRRDAARRATGIRAKALRRLLFAVDTAAVAAGWLVAVATTGGVVPSSQPRALTIIVVAGLTAITIALIASQKLYLSRVCTVRTVETVRLGRAAAGAGVAALLLPRALPIDMQTATAAIGAFSCFGFLLTVRGIYRHWLQAGRKSGRFIRPVVVVGANDEALELCKLVSDHPELGLHIVGTLGDHPLLAEHRPPHLGGLERAAEIVQAVGAGGVIIAGSALSGTMRNSLIRAFLGMGVHVQLSTGVQGIDHRRLRAQPLAHEPLFYVEPLRLAPWKLVVKRAIDLALTIVGGLLFALPLLAVAALAIKLQDGGSVLYRQSRIGRYGKPFTILKLRTMTPNADKLYDELARTRAGRDGPLIKLAGDPRRTRVGRFLERTSIDELPQLFNILKGEMSLVGPRPAQAAEVAAFDEELLTRLDVRPGITGLWQVEARDNPHFSAYRRYDLFYMENWSVGLDLAILLGTFQRVVMRGVELCFSRNRSEMSAARPLPSSVPS